MGWLAALWQDVLRHVHQFELAAPRTVDQLMAWVALLALLYAIWRYLRGWVLAILMSRPQIRVIVTAMQLKNFRVFLDRQADRGFFEPRLGTLYLAALLGATQSLVVLGFVVMGIAAMIGDAAAFWIAIGFGALVIAALEASCADVFSLIRLLAGRNSRYAHLLIRAKIYADAEIVRKHDLLKDQHATIIKELPLVLQRLRRIRKSLGLPEQDFPDLEKVTSKPPGASG